MNPVDEWEKARISEIENGGKATVCIMGCDDFDSFMGALSILYGISPIGVSGYMMFRNVEVMKSYSSKTGTMFA